MSSVQGDTKFSTKDRHALAINSSAAVSSQHKKRQCEEEHMLTVFDRLIETMVPPTNQRTRKVICFPVKLYCLLEIASECGFHHIISWKTHGRSFIIHDKELFSRTIAPK
jgi:hypothetical protein